MGRKDFVRFCVLIFLSLQRRDLLMGGIVVITDPVKFLESESDDWSDRGEKWGKAKGLRERRR